MKTTYKVRHQSESKSSTVTGTSPADAASSHGGIVAPELNAVFSQTPNAWQVRMWDGTITYVWI